MIGYDKELVTKSGEVGGGGGLQNGRQGGGACEVLPLWKGVAEKVLAMGGQSFGVVFTWWIEV